MKRKMKEEVYCMVQFEIKCMNNIIEKNCSNI